MRNFKIILFFAVLFGTIGYSCKKEENALINKSNSEKNYSERVINRINNFSETMNNSMKSGEKMNIDTAVWNLEALICYENAYPDSSSKNFVTYKSYYTLAIDNDSLVNNHDVQTVYQLMLDSISYHLSTINSSMKYLVFSDVKIDTIIGNNAYLQSINGYGFNLILGWYTPFGPDDDWIWGYNQGSCNSSPLTELSDASDEMQFRLNHPAVQTNTGADGYTDYETVEITVMNCERDNGVYYMYSGNNYYYCMNNDELTYRLEGAHNLIYNLNNLGNDDGNIFIIEDQGEGARPANKNFISIEIEDGTFVGNLYLHKYIITYAKPYFKITE